MTKKINFFIILGLWTVGTYGAGLDFLWSGGISDTSVVVAAKTSLHSGTNQCRLLIYSDDEFQNRVFESAESSPADVGNNYVVKLHARTGLVANTDYYYRVEINGQEDTELTGRFKTFPEPKKPSSFRIAFANSNNDIDSPVYDWLQTYNPLFFINTGDFHYEDINDSNEVQALTRHQTAYELNLNVIGGAANQAAFYRQTPFVYMWDDHDFGPDNCHAKGSFSGRRVTPESQAAAHTVYRRYIPHWPIDLEGNPSFETDRAPIAQAFTVGRVRFILTDIRSQSEQNGSTAYDATLLGEEQRIWFKEELLKANGSYALIVWLTTTPWNGTQSFVNGNKWYQHTGERTEIANFLKDNHIRGFSAIGGDAHMTAIDDGSNTDFATGGGAGFPLIHAAPIGTKNSYKAGPYSEGASHQKDNQYGAMELEDRTNELVVTWLGLDGPSSADVITSTHSDNPGNPLKYVFTNSWPLIATLSPADDSAAVDVNTNLVITFNEPIQKGSGNLRIHRLSDNVAEQTIAVTSTAVTVAGKQMTINPPDDLRDDTDYYITIDQGVVTDGSSDFPGIYAADGIDYKKWNFSTSRNDAYYALPFSENFEALDLGSISGQRGWTGEGTVQTGTVYAGSQAGRLQNGTLDYLFDDHPERVDIAFYAKPNGGAAIPMSIPSNATVVFYVNSNLHIVAYSNQTTVELAASIVSNDWNFFEISCDYTTDTWNLSVNSMNALQNFPFYNAATGFVGISFSEESGTPSFFDNIAITSSEEDSDSDTLPDAWEKKYYGNLSPNPGDISSNGVNTVWETYIAGLNPTNSASIFIFTNQQHSLGWDAASGRLYTVYWTSNLLSDFSPIASNITSAPFVDTQRQDKDAGFYKLKVELE